MLRPYNHEMDMYEVSTLVNSVANNSSALITPVVAGADAPVPTAVSAVKASRCDDQSVDPDMPVQMKLL